MFLMIDKIYFKICADDNTPSKKNENIDQVIRIIEEIPIRPLRWFKVQWFNGLMF